MRVAVVGGGLGGLAAARALLAAGVDAHVFEASSRAGGVLGTSTVDGFVREHAASSFLGGPSRGALAMCRTLGVEIEQASPRAKNRFIYIDGKLRALPRSPLGLVTSDLLTWRGKLDLIREPLRPKHAGAVDESVHAFAARRLGAEAARAIVAPFVTGVYAADAHEISLEAGFPRLAALESHGGLARGLAREMARGLLAKAIGKKSSKTPRGLYAPKGGLGTLVEALAAQLGPALRLGTRIAEVAPDPKGVRVDGELFDGAVLAIPAQDAAPLVPLADLANRLSMFRRAPTALVYLGYREADVAKARDGFGALVAIGEAPRVLGIVFESTVWSGRAPAGHMLLRCIFGGGRDPAAYDLNDAQLIDRATRDAGIVLGASGVPVHASVIRWPRGVAQYAVGHRDVVREAVTVARTHKIVLAGADYRGPGLNDLCTDADLVVAEVRAWS
ncbi:MAG: protoporphyrinogen oxidase [Myxococcota bacterium]|nr:protoporphyrinogen oxidase [Myxococcota bacterium]